MKRLLKIVLQLANTLILAVNRVPLRSNTYFMSNILCGGDNLLSFTHTCFERSRIRVSGSANSIYIHSATVSRCAIVISGSNNRLVIEAGVCLRSAVIHIRGNDCLIHIGSGTSFGGIRIVNVGDDNEIAIGRDCLFADHIEIWAGDSHPIFDHLGQLKNPAEPVVIGDHVWVGSRVIILKGVTIGDGSVVGMGSLVVNDIPMNCISAGNPNRTVKDNYGYWKR